MEQVRRTNPIEIPNSKVKMASPEELISFYEAKGLNTQEASMKVIEDLQSAVMRLVSSERGRKDRLLSDASRKIDSVSNRLSVLERKLDSKPGYLETFTIGLTSGAALPHILGALAQISNAVRTLTTSDNYKPPPPS